MTRYIISDFHLGHENIIDYCNRPFSDIDEMNTALIENWNEVVTSNDTVYYLGDFAFGDVETIIEFYEQLSGEMILIRGNHDSFEADEVPFRVELHTTLTHNGEEFYFNHRPLEVPDGSNWWIAHGHVHNNDPDTHPFIFPSEKRVNVSCELLAYKPISLDNLVNYMSRNRHYTTIADAENE